MKIFSNTTALLLILTCTVQGFSQQNISTRYLNEQPPGLTPVLFAPQKVSTPDRVEFGSIFTKDGNTFYYAVNVQGKAEILVSKFVDNAWTPAEKFLTHDQYSYNDPFLSPDEKRLYFISDQPANAEGPKKDYDIWYVEHSGTTWSKPITAGSAINSPRNEYYMSFTKTGTMYFSSNKNAPETNHDDYDVYASKMINGEFQIAEKLPDAINTKNYEADVFVAPDESYVIFCANKPGGHGRGDLYISFKNKDNTWTQSKNLGPLINGEKSEYCPFVTPDGKYFFYTKSNDIYWVDSKILETMR
jgi:hypothetical protein